MRRLLVPVTRVATAAVLARYCSSSSNSSDKSTATTTAAAAPPRLYTDSHEWVQASKDDASVITVGITKYAQQILGDIVYVTLPQNGSHVDAQSALADVESVKATSVVYAPATGTVCEVNERLRDQPGLMNTSPEDEGWVARLSSATLQDGLMTEEQYAKFLE